MFRGGACLRLHRRRRKQGTEAGTLFACQTELESAVHNGGPRGLASHTPRVFRAAQSISLEPPSGVDVEVRACGQCDPRRRRQRGSLPCEGRGRRRCLAAGTKGIEAHTVHKGQEVGHQHYRSITQMLTDSERTTETRLQRGHGTIVDGDVVAGRDVCVRVIERKSWQESKYTASI